MLTEPRAGDNISADWAMELVREIRRNRPIQGENIRVAVTPNGTVIHGTPGGGRGSSAASAPGRFAIKSMSSGAGRLTIELENLYYRVAGRTFVIETEKPVEVSAKSAVIALEIAITDSSPSGSVTTYDSLDELQEAERDISKYVVPLYLIVDGKVECDFRLGPETAMGEFLP